MLAQQSWQEFGQDRRILNLSTHRVFVPGSAAVWHHSELLHCNDKGQRSAESLLLKAPQKSLNSEGPKDGHGDIFDITFS